MGKTSNAANFNVPGKPAWILAESVGPLNLLFILLTLPAKLKPVPTASTSFLGTGLPAQFELLGSLYLLHYSNRAFVMPAFLNPHISPMVWYIPLSMAAFQFHNSSNIACWLTYSTLDRKELAPLLSPLALVGLACFFVGLINNIRADMTFFSLRRGAAKRKAKSEGKAVITYNKVYIMPPPSGLFKHVLFPHYSWEWLEWTGFAILGYAYGLGLDTPAAWFVLNEIAFMAPRALSGKTWYEQKFGKRALANRGAVVPVSWL